MYNTFNFSWETSVLLLKDSKNMLPITFTSNPLHNRHYLNPLYVYPTSQDDIPVNKWLSWSVEAPHLDTKPHLVPNQCGPQDCPPTPKHHSLP